MLVIVAIGLFGFIFDSYSAEAHAPMDTDSADQAGFSGESDLSGLLERGELFFNGLSNTRFGTTIQQLEEYTLREAGAHFTPTSGHREAPPQMSSGDILRHATIHALCEVVRNFARTSEGRDPRGLAFIAATQAVISSANQGQSPTFKILVDQLKAAEPFVPAMTPEEQSHLATLIRSIM